MISPATARRLLALVGPLNEREHGNLLGEYSAIRGWARENGLEHRIPSAPAPRLDSTIHRAIQREADVQRSAARRDRRPRL